ncbi:MAG: hypothetical protein DRQ55_02410 [Planctomycetota bacterium]|nr:MAG: hypothetical protein DRQ55_02410 [Planctomycetota bacterium]
MNGLLTVALLAFLLALGTFCVRGLDGHQRAQREAAALDARADELQQTLGHTQPVAWARLSSLEQAQRQARSDVDGRLSLLLDPLDAPSPPAAAAVLAASSMPSLQPGAPLQQRLQPALAADPDFADAVASLALRLEADGIFDLEDVTDLGSLHDELLPELSTRRLECVVLAELPAALGLLEQLVPRPAPLLLSVSSASIRRINPGLWPRDPTGLGSPPVRLWVQLDVTRRSRSEPGQP